MRVPTSEEEEIVSRPGAFSPPLLVVMALVWVLAVGPRPERAAGAQLPLRPLRAPAIRDPGDEEAPEAPRPRASRGHGPGRAERRRRRPAPFRRLSRR
jgi:hypothetical protein